MMTSELIKKIYNQCQQYLYFSIRIYFRLVINTRNNVSQQLSNVSRKRIIGSIVNKRNKLARKIRGVNARVDPGNACAVVESRDVKILILLIISIYLI